MTRRRQAVQPRGGKLATAIGAPPHGKRVIFRTRDAVDDFADDKDA